MAVAQGLSKLPPTDEVSLCNFVITKQLQTNDNKGENIDSSFSRILIMLLLYHQMMLTYIIVIQLFGLCAISLPNGCNSFPPVLLPQLSRFTRVYLWLDDDESGRRGCEKIASLIGIDRCWVVRGSGTLDDIDTLSGGGDIETSSGNRKQVLYNSTFITL